MKTLKYFTVLSLALFIQTAFAAPPVLRSAWTTNAIPTAGTANNTTLTGTVNLDGIAATKLLSVDASKNIVSGGSGTANTLPKFTAGATLGNSSVSDDASNVTIATGVGLKVDDGSDPVFFVDAANNRVSINEGSPTYFFTVRRPGGVGAVAFDIDNIGGDRDVIVRAVPDTGTENAGFYFFINKSTGQAAAFCFQHNGQMGVNTHSPHSTLHVSGSVAEGFASINGTITLDSGHSFVACDAAGGAFSVFLPSAVGIPGRCYSLKRISAANNVTIDADGAQTIDGAGTYVLTAQWQSVTVISDNVNWLIK